MVYCKVHRLCGAIVGRAHALDERRPLGSLTGEVIYGLSLLGHNGASAVGQLQQFDDEVGTNPREVLRLVDENASDHGHLVDRTGSDEPNGKCYASVDV